MNILLAYGHDTYSTAVYFERSLKKKHHVVFCGTSSPARPQGYPFFVDLPEIIRTLGIQPDLYLYIDAHRACFPLATEKVDCPTAGLMIDLYPNSDMEAKSSALQLFDYGFVMQKDHMAKVWKWHGLETSWTAPACDQEIHRDHQLPRVYDVGFVGGLGGVHRRRIPLLERLAGKYKMNDYRRFIPPDEMGRVYSQSKIVCNFCTPWNDINMRMFEATACGAMLLTPRIENGQPDLYRDGEHIVSYETEAELFQKVEYYLAHESERARIAAAGQAHTLLHHTYDRRVDAMLKEIFDRHGGARRCRLRTASAAEVRRAARPYLAQLMLRDLASNFHRVGFDGTMLPRLARNFYRAVVVPRLV